MILDFKLPVDDIQFIQISRMIEQRLWPELREIVQSFGLSREKIWSEGFSLLDSLIECRDYRLVKIVVRLLFVLGPVVETNNEFPLLHFVFFFAILFKNRPLIDKLLTVTGVSVNDPLSGEFPLCCAIRTQAGLDIIRLIIDRGARVNETEPTVDLTPLGLVIGNPPSDLDLAELLLSYGADVNKTYPESVTRTLVNLACETSNYKGLKWLLSHNADPNVQTKCGQTPLHISVTLGDLSSVITLLEFGASINALNSAGQAPLTIAVERNKTEIAELLLQHGAEFCNTTLSDAFKENITTNDMGRIYNSAQHKMFDILTKQGFVLDVNINDKAFIRAAARQGHVWIIKTFLEAGGLQSSAFVNTSLLSDAVKSRNKDLVELLLAHEPDTTCNKTDINIALFHSISSNLVEITALLLSKGDTTGLSHYWPFWITMAAVNLNIDMFKVFLKFGVSDFNIRDIFLSPLHHAIMSRKAVRYLSPLHYAIISNKAVSRLKEDIDLEKAEVVRFLLNHGAIGDPWQDLGPAEHPIHVAIRRDYVQVVRVLLEAGTSFDHFVLDEANLLPSTILHFAVSYNSKEMVKVLLEKGATVDALQFDGKTPLRIAVESNASKAVRVLLENGANVKNTSTCNQHLLFNAIDGRSSTEIIDELLKFGADVDNKRNGGETALHKACLLGDGDVIAVLLNHGADINAEDSMEKTPFMQFKKALLAMRIVAQGTWFRYEHGEAIAGPNTPLYHLQRHAFKMNFVGLPLHPCYKSALKLKYSNEFISSCKEELEAMKTFKIGSNYLCLYDVIKQKQDPVYVSNNNVVFNLDGDHQWENFTLYRGVFKRLIKTAKLRNELLDAGQKFLSDVIRFSCLNILPEEVIHKIVTYFKDEELQILQTTRG